MVERAELVREILAQEEIIRKARNVAEVGNLRLKKLDLQLEVHQLECSIETFKLDS